MMSKCLSGRGSIKYLIAEFFERYGPMVYRRALNMMGNPADAEEVTQEVFIRALKGLEKFKGESKASTWLYKQIL